ncbi:MAG: APC family permease, partial [Firmicutes bacterium]|nr:APC family permease [Bacillota bacterium]
MAKGLRKDLSLLDLTMASLGGIIGSGWLFGALYAAKDAGPASVISWIIGGIAVIFIVLIFAELSSKLPASGGVARYPHYSHGHLTSFIMGWAVWIGYAASPAIQAEAMVQYASHYIPHIYNPTTDIIQGWGMLLASGLMVVFFIINYWGVKMFARINTPLTFIKFIMPVVTLLFFLWKGLHWHNFSHYSGFAPMGSAGVMQAVATSGVIFAYLGFRQAVDLSGEARHPERDVPRAIMLSIAIGIVLYVMLQVVFVGSLTPHMLRHGWMNLSLSAPFAQAAAGLGLGWLATLLYADAVVSPAGTGNVYMASTTRVLYALAQNGYFPRALTKVDPDTGIPVMALVIALVLGILFLMPFPAWNQMVAMISSATVLTYVIGPVSLAVFRRTAPELNQGYRVPTLSIIGPVAFVIGSLIIYWTGWAIDWKLMALLAAGLVIYGVAIKLFPSQIARPSRRSIRSAYWLI